MSDIYTTCKISNPFGNCFLNENNNSIRFLETEGKRKKNKIKCDRETKRKKIAKL